MKIGMIGLGKLGMPVAEAIQQHGHEVWGWDINPDLWKQLPEGMELAPGWEMVKNDLDIIFVAVQTPHKPEHDGTHMLTGEWADFDTSHLLRVLEELDRYAELLEKPTVTVAVISTVLPQTFEREITYKYPRLELTYNPLFISMGNVIADYNNPEFILLGGPHTEKVEEFYESLTLNTRTTMAPIIATDYTTAEAIKVSYNTFITAKTVLANTWGQICEKLHINSDDLFRAWTLSDQRLISERYLQAGMSDGGPCHPRDNIALAHLSERLNLEYNYFEHLMEARQSHEEWLADMCISYNNLHDFPGPITVFGTAFKPGTDITEGSPALLLARILDRRKQAYVMSDDPTNTGKTNFIATKHERYKDIKWPQGSIVIDPFGYIPYQEGVKVIRVGRK